MAHMDDDALLAHLQHLEDDAATFMKSGADHARYRAQREYFRMPYGTEEEGWSQIVTSDVQDTIEGILPDLLDIFTSSDQAVVFEPQQAQDVDGAQQATDACNYVFYRQNDGFLVLYNAFKDALLQQNAAVMWRKETKQVRTVIPVTNATPEMLAMALSQAGEGAKIEAAEELPPQPPPMPQGPPPGMPGMGGPPGGPPPGMMPPGPGPGMPPPNMAPGGPPPPMGQIPPGAMPGRPPGIPPNGPSMPAPPFAPNPMAMAMAAAQAAAMPPPPPLFNARIAKLEDKTTVRVESFSPDDLLVKRTWTSPLLQDCPYVARNFEVSLSDLHEMGFTDVTGEELAASLTAVLFPDGKYRDRRNGLIDYKEPGPLFDGEDHSRSLGYLRIEYVLVDYDGDGISERREIYRLKQRILRNEECDQVPIATASPVLIPHRWDGMSIAEMVSDIQQLKTELTRQMLNNAYLANNPRKKVLTDVNWSPLANVDDLLDGRPGGLLRQRDPNAITIDQTPWIGGNVMPLLQYIDDMRAERTGLSKQAQGLDPDTLRPDRTATEIQMTMTAAKQRVRLIARILAECLMKPIFHGILKLLTDKGMEPLAFRLNGKFVQYDPNEWRDSYDMTVNVGLGTGDRTQQHAMLMGILQNQMGLVQSPFGPLLITPQQIYNSQAKLTENAGYKNVADFFTDPMGKQIPPQQPQPNPMLQVAQVRAQSQQAVAQMQAQLDMQKSQMQAAQDARENDQKTAHEGALEQLRIHAQQVAAQSAYQLQASNDQRDAEREQLKAAYQSQLDAMKLRLDEWKAQLDSDTKIAVAQITAGAQIAVKKLNGPPPGVSTQ